MQRATASFEVVSWEQNAYDEPEEGPALGRVTIKKVFAGHLEGESTAELLTCGEQGYVANERITGRLDGRAGTFVVQHGGVRGGRDAPATFGNIIPKSGTGELEGLLGRVEYRHGESGASITIDFEFDLEPA